MYSIDYRKRAVEYKREGHTFKKLYEAFKINNQCYYNWSREYDATNGYTNYTPKPKQKRKGKIDKEKLALAVKEKPDAYLRELAKPFGCSPTAVFYALEEMGLTLKKRPSHTRRNPKQPEQNISQK